MENKDYKKAFNIAFNWYNVINNQDTPITLAEGESPDDMFRFMTYWMSFNFLFGSYYFSSKNLLDFNNPVCFVKSELELVRQLKTYDIDFLKNSGVITDYLRSHQHNGEQKKYYYQDSLQYYINYDTERAKIVIFTHSIMNRLINSAIVESICHNKKGDLDYKWAIKDDPVKDANSFGDPQRDHSKYFYDILVDEEKDIRLRYMCLMMIIYQIRCNLFHGDKRPEVNRDRQLVSEAAYIMDKVLKITQEDISSKLVK